MYAILQYNIQQYCIVESNGRHQLVPLDVFNEAEKFAKVSLKGVCVCV